MTWYYNGEPVTAIDPQYQSFVYRITNLVSGRQYIGFKLATFAKTKQVKGKKKKIRVESDWRDYWSSSEELNADVQRLGQENFKREILYWCKLKAHGKYLELKEQMDNRVLENPEQWYNGIVNARISRNHIKSL